MSAEFDAWAVWQNYGTRREPAPGPPPEEFNITVLNNHGQIRRGPNADGGRIFLTCLVCCRAVGAVRPDPDPATLAEAIGSAKRGIRKHLKKVHGIDDPHAGERSQ